MEKTIFDFGSNMGALSFECARRGASNVIGFEYNKERVDVCNDLVTHLGLHNIRFIEYYIEKLNLTNIKDFTNVYGHADIVFCCALDAYVDKYKLYDIVSKVCREVCLFETNSGIKTAKFIEEMTKRDFELIIPLGLSKTDSQQGNFSYILVPKSIMLSSQIKKRRGKKYISKFDTIHRVMNSVIKYYSDEDVTEKYKRIYEKIKDIPYVPDYRFIDKYIIMPYYGNDLSKFNADETTKKIIKNQLIDFITQLVERRIVHADLHIGNSFFYNGVLKVCDWE